MKNPIVFDRNDRFILRNGQFLRNFPTPEIPGSVLETLHFCPTPPNYSDRRLSVGLTSAARMTRRLMVRRLIARVIRPASTKIHQERVTR